MNWLWAAMLIPLAVLVAACPQTGDLEDRIDALEAQPQIGDFIVVGKEYRAVTGRDVNQACIRYRVFDSTGGILHTLSTLRR